jgi:hypothetical protein
MDLHVYRNSQDRGHDLRTLARERGAVLAVNALTVEELVQRITPDLQTATPGQRLAVVHQALSLGELPSGPFSPRYFHDAINELKAARVRPLELRSAGVDLLADILDYYDQGLGKAGLCDPQDRRALAAARVKEGGIPWLQKFDRVVLHALYDLTDAEFLLASALIETLPEGGAVILFNTTANIKPTQFAEWTWQRFIRDESLAERTVPEFCRSSNPARPVLEKLFVFDAHDPLPLDDSLRIVECPGRYKEAEVIGSEIAELLQRGEIPSEIAVVPRHIERYGEMLEDVFTRYGIPHSFETGVPLLRIPFVKYWLSLLDLVTNERSRPALGRVMASAYFNPRLSPDKDVEFVLSEIGYIDRHHLRASALAARKNSALTAELERLEKFLDSLEGAADDIGGFSDRLKPAVVLTGRDRDAWRVLADELEAVRLLYPGKQTFAEFRRVASEIAAACTVDRLSSAAMPGLSRVRILSPQALGAREYKWMFAPGFADGEFPARSSANPLLTDDVIDCINARIRPRRLMNSRDRNRREPLYLFVTLDSASRRVTLTYPNSTLEGETVYPSVYIGEIARHFEASPIVSSISAAGPARTPFNPSGAVARGESEWRVQIAAEWRKGTLTEGRARSLLGSPVVDKAGLEAKGIGRAQLGRNVLPLEGQWHPSELNALEACPFVFLARHRLRLRAVESPDFEVPVSEIGILAHNILRDFYSDRVPESLDQARHRMDEIVARRLAAVDITGQGPYSVFDPSLWKIRRRQLVSVLNEYVKFAVRDSLDGFETRPEYLDAPLPPASIGRITLGGRPDHVAVRRGNDGIDAIRIDDFKYSAASSGSARQLKESFQIPVYAYLACQALGAGPAAHIEGRYLLLKSPASPVVAYPIGEAVFEDIRQRIEVLQQKVREGRLAPAPSDPQGCNDCDYRRLCRLYGG